MIPIKAIYNIPSIKHTFFIASPKKKHLSLEKVSRSLKRRAFLDEILLRKHNPSAMNVQKWVAKVVSESDVYAVLNQKENDGILLDNRSSKNPDFLELLTITAIKFPTYFLDETFSTPKVLRAIPDSDVLEIFIV